MILRPFVCLVCLSLGQGTLYSQNSWDQNPIRTDSALIFSDDLDFYLNSYRKDEIKKMRKQVNILKMSVNKVMRERVSEVRAFSEGTAGTKHTVDLSLPTTTGGSYTLSENRGKVCAFMFVSVTNPPAMFQLKRWDKLREKFDTSQVDLFMIYGRELHPGEKGFRRYVFPKNDAEKMIYAQELAAQTTLPVLVDGIDERVQKTYGEVPNAAFVVDQNGVLVFRGTWADSNKIEHVTELLLKEKFIGR